MRCVETYDLRSGDVAGMSFARLSAERKYCDPWACYADVRPEAEATGRLLAGNVPCGGSDGATPKLPLRMLYWEIRN